MVDDGDDDDDGSGFRLFLVFVGIVGFGAVVFSAVGLVTILTGGPDTDEAASVPDAFECDQFHGAPDVGHEAAYGISRNATVGALHSIDGTSTDDGFEVRFNVSDPELLAASARQADGTPVPVEIRNTTVVVAHNDTAPFRVWIDSAEGGFITRSELDICPPR